MLEISPSQSNQAFSKGALNFFTAYTDQLGSMDAASFRFPRKYNGTGKSFWVGGRSGIVCGVAAGP